MKQSDALNIIDKLLPAFQKFKSNVYETFEIVAKDPAILKDMLPRTEKYIFGEMSPGPFLENIQDNGYIEPMQWYNMMTLFHNRIPEFIAVQVLWGIELPEPDMQLIANGWEDE